MISVSTGMCWLRFWRWPPWRTARWPSGPGSRRTILPASWRNGFRRSRIWSGLVARKNVRDQSDDEEIAMVRDLLLAQRSSEGECRPLARRDDRTARDGAESSVGRSRPARPLRTDAAAVAPFRARSPRATPETCSGSGSSIGRSAKSDGFVMCTTPVCTECRDFDLCFGDESGESRMAERRREVACRRPRSRPHPATSPGGVMHMDLTTTTPWIETPPHRFAGGRRTEGADCRSRPKQGGFLSAIATICCAGPACGRPASG